MGKRRAEQLAALLQGANLKSPSYKVTWRDESAKATGVDDYASAAPSSRSMQAETPGR